MIDQLNGSFDNFLQYWKQNTDEDQHASRVEVNHRHYHIKFNNNQVELFEGRNNEKFIASSSFSIYGSTITLFGIEGLISEKSNNAVENYIHISEEGLTIQGFNHFNNPLPYTFKKCRNFAGWIMNLLPDTEEEYNRVDQLTIHDQGGLAELVYEGKIYTVELTQLEFAHTIKVFKLAFYDVLLKNIGINSKAFAYTWTNPEAKRIGMNLRYVQSGWTLIEEGYVNSDNLGK